MKEINKIDQENYNKIRNNVSDFIKKISKEQDREDFILLDIAPEIHKGAKEHFKNCKVLTLDLNPDSDSDYILDICNCNDEYIPDNTFDVIICTEVLEHTNNPFKAVEELKRIVKKGGIVCVSTPFNFRIHGPLPDNWRFTVHGLKCLFSEFSSVTIEELVDEDRFLMPIHYTLIAKK